MEQPSIEARSVMGLLRLCLFSPQRVGDVHGWRQWRLYAEDARSSLRNRHLSSVQAALISNPRLGRDSRPRGRSRRY